MEGLAPFDRRYCADAFGPRFSGAALLDNARLLVGVHLGAVEADEQCGRAVRIADVIRALTLLSVKTSNLDYVENSFEPVLPADASLVKEFDEPACGQVSHESTGVFLVDSPYSSIISSPHCS